MDTSPLLNFEDYEVKNFNSILLFNSDFRLVLQLKSNYLKLTGAKNILLIQYGFVDDGSEVEWSEPVSIGLEEFVLELHPM